MQQALHGPRLVLDDHAQNVFEIEDADDVIEVAAVDRHPHVPDIDEPAGDFLGRRADLQGLHAHPRHHHLARRGVGKLEDTLN